MEEICIIIHLLFGKQFGKESVRVKWTLRSLFHLLERDERSHARQE